MQDSIKDFQSMGSNQQEGSGTTFWHTAVYIFACGTSTQFLCIQKNLGMAFLPRLQAGRRNASLCC